MAAAAATLSFEQAERLARGLGEGLQLVARDDGLGRFRVRGSGRRVYRVDLRGGTGGRVTCSCPDAEHRSAQLACLCKHACFVLARVLRLPRPTFVQLCARQDRALTAEQLAAAAATSEDSAAALLPEPGPSVAPVPAAVVAAPASRKRPSSTAAALVPRPRVARRSATSLAGGPGTDGTTPAYSS